MTLPDKYFSELNQRLSVALLDKQGEINELRATLAERDARIARVRFQLGRSIFHLPDCLGRLTPANWMTCTMCGIIRDLTEPAGDAS